MTTRYKTRVAYSYPYVTEPARRALEADEQQMMFRLSAEWLMKRDSSVDAYFETRIARVRSHDGHDASWERPAQMGVS